MEYPKCRVCGAALIEFPGGHDSLHECLKECRTQREEAQDRLDSVVEILATYTPVSKNKIDKLEKLFKAELAEKTGVAS